MRREKGERNCHVRCGAWKDSGKKWTEEDQNPVFHLVREGCGSVFCWGLGCKIHIGRTKEGRKGKWQSLLPQSGEITPSQHNVWYNYDRGGGYNVIISDINGIQSLSEESEGITNYRRKKNMGHIHWCVSVWVKEDKMCQILNCFPTLSEAHSLNPVNDYMRYLRYHLQNQPFASHISKKSVAVFFFFIIHFFPSLTLPLLSLCLSAVFHWKISLINYALVGSGGNPRHW